jgi:hypothetical protein
VAAPAPAAAPALAASGGNGTATAVRSSVEVEVAMATSHDSIPTLRDLPAQPASKVMVEGLPVLNASTSSDRITAPGTSGDRIPAAAISGDRIPAAGTSGDRIPAAGASGDRIPAAGTSGDRYPAAGTSGDRMPAAGTSNDRLRGPGTSGDRLHPELVTSTGEHSFFSNTAPEGEVHAGDEAPPPRTFAMYTTLGLGVVVVLVVGLAAFLHMRDTPAPVKVSETGHPRLAPAPGAQPGADAAAPRLAAAAAGPDGGATAAQGAAVPVAPDAGSSATAADAGAAAPAVAAPGPDAAAAAVAAAPSGKGDAGAALAAVAAPASDAGALVQAAGPDPSATAAASPAAPATAPAAVPAAAAAAGGDYDAALKEAKSFYARSRLKKAAEAYGRALAVNPRGDAALVGMANTLMDQEKFAPALEFATRAVEANPDNADARLSCGALYQAIGKKKEAREHYEAYLRLAPKGKNAGEVRTILRGLK